LPVLLPPVALAWSPAEVLFWQMQTAKEIECRISQLHTEIEAVKACLKHAGFLSDFQLQVQLHRQRFEAIRRASKWEPDSDIELQRIVQLGDMGARFSSFLGSVATHCLGSTSTAMLTALHEFTANVYVFGGADAHVQPVSTVERFNPCSGSWTKLDHKMPIRATNHAAAVLAGQVYLCGVGFEDFAGRVIEFQPRHAPHLAWRVHRSQGNFRYRVNVTAIVLFNKLYVCGGELPRRMGRVLDLVQRLDPTSDEQWETVPPMSEARSCAACACISGKLMVCGGRGGAELHMTKQSVELFDPSTDRWEIGPPMLVTRGCHAAAYASACVYVCGGFSRNSFPYAEQSAELFQRGKSNWVALPSMKVPRAGAASAMVGGKIYMTGGCVFLSQSNSHTRICLNSVECYDPVSGSWEIAPSMLSPRAFHAAGTSSKF